MIFWFSISSYKQNFLNWEVGGGGNSTKYAI